MIFEVGRACAAGSNLDCPRAQRTVSTRLPARNSPMLNIVASSLSAAATFPKIPRISSPCSPNTVQSRAIRFVYMNMHGSPLYSFTGSQAMSATSAGNPDPNAARDTLRRAIVNALWQLGIRPPYCDTFDAGGTAIAIHIMPPGASIPGTMRASGHTPACRECEAAVLLLLADLGRAATWKEIRTELKLRGKKFGVGVMRGTLARLVREGRLTNPRDRLGYRVAPDLP